MKIKQEDENGYRKCDSICRPPLIVDQWRQHLYSTSYFVITKCIVLALLMSIWRLIQCSQAIAINIITIVHCRQDHVSTKDRSFCGGNTSTALDFCLNG
ncbi:uncharacterized protein PITG_19188 [Phytophthora infestans T30-4]|uniref:Transmembrane protein n=1 Tax=Phytophthora infestans (strain T30-4) TaxID=403677 RepID=D0NZJ4_PHYIT|nr:uncharacterized protein PITG_19188 [Phytophthora infestans T30-4]EEY69551.1 hypothetical protein PITG_19188 [Phytophthora infestans T30-4]|eukprot:XP_002997228.1 hypothetical protein PITG_19188 [Phytophthora infestans T30-4]